MEEIKIAYRRAARATHPDLGGSEEKFKEVQQAFQDISVLANPLSHDETFQKPGEAPRAGFSARPFDERLRKSPQRAKGSAFYGIRSRVLRCVVHLVEQRTFRTEDSRRTTQARLVRQQGALGPRSQHDQLAEQERAERIASGPPRKWGGRTARWPL
ncbi:DnaJ domain-containing protein [Glutamicibacter halophytocola]|uniref:DnaJ domain-containing protein n=1 Tax=Glutamicibacter halophytocola TaxID=1933880 RepID=UPI0032192AFC